MPLEEQFAGIDEAKTVRRILSYICEQEHIVDFHLKPGTNLLNVIAKINDSQYVGFVEIFTEILKNSKNFHNLLGKTQGQKYLVRQWVDYGIRYVVGNRYQFPAVLKDLDMALSKTFFIAGDFLTLSDLVMFYGLYSSVVIMEEEEKEKYNNLSHWFWFLQKDNNLIQNLKKVTFPKSICEIPGESFLDKRKVYSSSTSINETKPNL